jgi:hypothetical protein
LYCVVVDHAHKRSERIPIIMRTDCTEIFIDLRLCVFLFHLLSPFLVSNESSGWRSERWIAKRNPAEEAMKKKKQNEAPGTELAKFTSQTSYRHETAVRATPGRKKQSCG